MNQSTAYAKNIKQKPIMIMAGGTGGHVYPALAVADELRARGVDVVWMGTKNGIEARLVPAANIQIEWLGISGLRGKGLLTLLFAPLKLIRACYQAYKIIRKINPSAVLGMGGFVSGPGGLMAWLMGKPLLIHEQNARPGLTNRLLAKISNNVMQAFPNSFKNKAETIGNPVRMDIAKIMAPEERLKSHHKALHLFVFGGSLGAAHFNSVVPKALAKISSKDFVVKHQSGAKNIDECLQNYTAENLLKNNNIQIMAYVEEMAEAYEWADIVLCRAGAMSVAELAAAGVASILVPYPHAVDDHQTANAQYLSEAGAGILIPQKDLDADHLANVLNTLTPNKIIEMSKKARALALLDSTKNVADRCMSAGGFIC